MTPQGNVLLRHSKQPFRITKRFQLEKFYGFIILRFKEIDDIKKKIVEMKFYFF
jgi:hypothetical protein